MDQQPSDIEPKQLGQNEFLTLLDALLSISGEHYRQLKDHIMATSENEDETEIRPETLRSWFLNTITLDQAEAILDVLVALKSGSDDELTQYLERHFEKETAERVLLLIHGFVKQVVWQNAREQVRLHALRSQVVESLDAELQGQAAAPEESADSYANLSIEIPEVADDLLPLRRRSLQPEPDALERPEERKFVIKGIAEKKPSKVALWVQTSIILAVLAGSPALVYYLANGPGSFKKLFQRLQESLDSEPSDTKPSASNQSLTPPDASPSEPQNTPEAPAPETPLQESSRSMSESASPDSGNTGASTGQNPVPSPAQPEPESEPAISPSQSRHAETLSRVDELLKDIIAPPSPLGQLAQEEERDEVMEYFGNSPEIRRMLERVEKKYGK